MKRISKLHFGDIGKSFSLAFVIITITWCFISYYSLGVVVVSWEIFAGNLAVSGVLSALYYRFRYHRILEYDDQQFTLRTGKKIVEGKWKEFSLVSLYHKGFGIFTVRLYRENIDTTDFVELPSTDLGLISINFRTEVAEYLYR